MPLSKHQREAFMPVMDAMNPRLRLPTELVHVILAQVIGDYFSSMIIASRPQSDIRTLPTILIICRNFRACVTKLLQSLCGELFVVGGSGPFRMRKDYGMSVLCLNDLSIIGYKNTVEVMSEHSSHILQTVLTRHSAQPLMCISCSYLATIALFKRHSSFKSGQKTYAKRRVHHESMWSRPAFRFAELKALHTVYRSVPGELRVLLLGDIWNELLQTVTMWMRVCFLDCAVEEMSLLVADLRQGITPEDTFESTRPQPEVKAHFEKILSNLCCGAASLKNHLTAFASDGPHSLTCETSCLTAVELQCVKFNRILTILDCLGTDGEDFDIQHIGRDCLISLLSEDEMMVNFI